MSEYSELMTEALHAEQMGNEEKAEELMAKIEELEEAEEEENDLTEREKVNLEMQEEIERMRENGDLEQIPPSEDELMADFEERAAEEWDEDEDDEDNPAVVELEAGKRGVLEYHDHVGSIGGD